jgi:hypothetical protein
MADLFPCPGGCGKTLHRRANECPQCGFRAEITVYQDLLSSLTTVSSILMGFGLAGLVSLAVYGVDLLDTIILQVAAGCWICSSIFLLVVLVMAELVRRRSGSEGVLALAADEQNRIIRHCNSLLALFVMALGFLALGVVVHGFHFSPWHGVVALTASVVGLEVIRRVLR